MSQCEIVVPVALKDTHTAHCTAPWFVQNTEYHPTLAGYIPLVNGQETFRAVHEAIARAEKTVDIICWGFQPSMYFIRDGKAPSIGELLRMKAASGVEVRILGWEAPLNWAGLGGEANLPGKGTVSIKNREGQVSTDQQYEYDREWFAKHTGIDTGPGVLKQRGMLAKIPKIMWRSPNGPRFIGRGFGITERAELVYRAAFHARDKLSATTLGSMAAAPTHHQKTVLVDYELPERAVGFVMGHNMLDEYWDCDKHSALNRSGYSKPAPNWGARGKLPRQDISSQVSGPVLEHLHHNFATAWEKETQEDLLKARAAMAIGKRLKTHTGTTVVAQLLRTQPQAEKRDIESLYLQAVNNATQCIYIENQYFRWPPLAELIKEVAARQLAGGRRPEEHGSLHLFVITNDAGEGIGPGTVNTQRMLECLGREERIPELTKLRRIDELTKRAREEGFEASMHLGPWQAQLLARERQARLQRDIEDVKSGEVKRPPAIPGLKVHVCSLVASDSPGDDWMPVYVHSKLMIVDDVFTTHGSANINSRSMMVDSEMNIAHDWASVSLALRKRLWDLHTNGVGGQEDPAEAFESWEELMKTNKKRRTDRDKPKASLVEFFYGGADRTDLD
ncbi:phosphatidylserine/phosphatidylglycerophosphate/cardiolipin synthase family protein [Pseudomonas sp. NPDC007930]|uniref:phospholipase D-like domain-containing protein n=1 Tax=Pseudomonas sp. NPDC007930 TaxID=3364417 RepID=UPI0036EA2151